MVRRCLSSGRKIHERIFVELFRALIQGRARFLKHGNDNNTRPSALASAIDLFRRTAGAYYSDAELFIRLSQEPEDDLDRPRR